MGKIYRHNYGDVRLTSHEITQKYGKGLEGLIEAIKQESRDYYCKEYHELNSNQKEVIKNRVRQKRDRGDYE